jgi:hypothetical protein
MIEEMFVIRNFCSFAETTQNFHPFFKYDMVCKLPLKLSPTLFTDYKTNLPLLQIAHTTFPNHLPTSFTVNDKNRTRQRKTRSALQPRKMGEV